MSNDTWAIRATYGVEVARRNIVLQIRAVFSVYSIKIDTRHLNLIADYMTFNGGYRAMNRNGIAERESSFLKMSVESTVTYFMDATANNHRDELTSPSIPNLNKWGIHEFIVYDLWVLQSSHISIIIFVTI